MTTRAEHAKKVLAMGLCRIVGIEPIDSLDGSPNWWIFSETAAKVIDDLQERGFLEEPQQEPNPSGDKP